MAIKASSSRQIGTLIADLSAVSAATRESAIARLTVLGARAVDPLVAAAVSGSDVGARSAAWRALEAIGDERALEAALRALEDPRLDPSIGVAAAGVARVHLRGAHGADVVDRLADVLLDPSRPDVLRLAALRALDTLGPTTVAPILTLLAHDPSAAIRSSIARSARLQPSERRSPQGSRHVELKTALIRAAEVGLANDPAALRRALSRSGGAVALPLLLRIIERVRDREAVEPAEGREEWTQTRAAAHLALAHRGSRLALYDLREALEASDSPLPVEYLAALSLVGDASCLEAIAAAHARAHDTWSREHLARAFREIVGRERLTKRHATIRRIEKRWPGVLDAP